MFNFTAVFNFLLKYVKSYRSFSENDCNKFSDSRYPIWSYELCPIYPYELVMLNMPTYDLCPLWVILNTPIYKLY